MAVKEAGSWEIDFAGTVPLIPLRTDCELLASGIKHCGVQPEQVVMQFGSWVVTDYGMECLTVHYPIHHENLDECYWATAMLKKRWVRRDDFLHCLEAARRYHVGQSDAPRRALADYSTLNNGLRFNILKRDGYRCQICGNTAADGVRLEVDHKIPRSKGGPTTEDNLQTTCYPCNRGKGDKDL